MSPDAEAYRALRAATLDAVEETSVDGLADNLQALDLLWSRLDDAERATLEPPP